MIVQLQQYIVEEDEMVIYTSSCTPHSEAVLAAIALVTTANPNLDVIIA